MYPNSTFGYKGGGVHGKVQHAFIPIHVVCGSTWTFFLFILSFSSSSLSLVYRLAKTLRLSDKYKVTFYFIHECNIFNNQVDNILEYTVHNMHFNIDAKSNKYKKRSWSSRVHRVHNYIWCSWKKYKLYERKSTLLRMSRYKHHPTTFKNQRSWLRV